MKNKMKRILSGMQPSGKLHLGNYLGALENWVKLQDSYECFYMVADWHALTSNYADTSYIKENTIEMVIDWLSSGLTPEKSVIFIQSQIVEHSELHLLFSMITPLGWLQRCPTYKQKQNELKEKDLSTYGFLGYPVLQAADILIYKASYVPVGEDQIPHLELTREIARRFNSFYGKVFPEPQALLTKVPKVIGTDGKKMSKSYNNCIYLSDSPKDIEKKINLMITDPQRIHPYDKGHPEVCSVFSFHKIFNGNVKDIQNHCKQGKIGCKECKKRLSNVLVEKFSMFREQRNKWENRRNEVFDILQQGKKKAQQIAQKTMHEVREKVKIGI